MKTLASPLLAAILTACGGGDLGNVEAGPITVNVTVEAGAITCDHCTVTIGGFAASAPAASSPGATPAPVDTSTIPLAQVRTGPPLIRQPGDFVVTSGGMTYDLIVVGADFGFIAMYSGPGTDVDQPMTSATILDSSLLDAGALGDGNDAAIRAYLVAKVLPNLDAWWRVNRSPLVNQAVIVPTSTAPVPLALTPINRMAALLAQWLKFDPVAGFSLQP